MTEKEDNANDAVEEKMDYDGRSVDWFLQNLVSIANNSNVEFGITLFVEGIIVSGNLVSGKKYFETFADEFSNAYPGDPDTKEGIRQAFASNSSIYDSEDDEHDLPRPQYIHLIDSRCFAPGGQPLPGNSGVLWRGKINSVSGFNLGSLT